MKYFYSFKDFYDTMLQIFLRTLQGKTISLEVSSSNTIKDVKIMIQDKEDIPSDKQTLVFCGKKMDDDKFVSDYDIESIECLYLLVN